MVFAKVAGFMLIVLGILIGLIHFGFLPGSLFGIDIATIGVLLFIAHEAYALFKNIASDGNKLVGVGVPLLFILIAGSYFIKGIIPGIIAANVMLIIAVLMCVEGFYRLH